MLNYVKEPHTAIFSGVTGIGKSHRMLDLIENEYKGHFEYIVIICPTIKWNAPYLDRPWVINDDNVFLIEPKNQLVKWLSILAHIFEKTETLFVLDDLIADKNLDKTRGSLPELAISGRHKDHSLWFLTQRYTKIPLTVRDQLKQLFIWYPKNRNELALILTENDIIDSKEEIKHAREQLKINKRACLYLRLEHPRGHKILF